MLSSSSVGRQQPCSAAVAAAGCPCSAAADPVLEKAAAMLLARRAVIGSGTGWEVWLFAKLEPAVESKLESDLGMRMIDDDDDDDEDG